MENPSGFIKKLQYSFRALRHRNYKLFFLGQGVSLIGTWMQRIAMSWLIYQLTGSAFLLGVVTFLNQLPTFLLAPIAGVYADRWDRKKTLIITQALSMIQALTLAILVLGGWIQVWHVVVLGSILGVINAFDIPIRQTFVRDLLEDPTDLPSAIALNSSLMNGARIVGPSIAGILISLVGEGICFLANGLSYIGVIWILYQMRVTAKKPSKPKGNVWHDLQAGSTYAFHDPLIRGVLISVTIVSLVGMSYTVLMPAVVAEILQGGPQTLGILMGAVGVGAILGAVIFSSLSTFQRLRKIIPYGAILMGVGLIFFAQANHLIGSILTLTAIGVGQIFQMGASNTLLQTISDPAMRGRIMSFYTMAFMGMAPFGAFLSGSLASLFGLSATFILSGIACILSGVFFLRYVPFPKNPPIEN